MIRGELKQQYVHPSCRIVPVRLENALLTASTDPLPVDPFDPELD
jgi:hypothetical protein